MRLLLNAIWFVFAGVWLAILWVFAAVGLALSIIGIPFAWQALKIAEFALWPFGRELVKVPGSQVREANAVGNVLWIVLVGWWLAVIHLIVGVLLVITIIGIPLGLGLFKMIPVTVAPFGREVARIGAAQPSGTRRPLRMPTSWRVRRPRTAL